MKVRYNFIIAIAAVMMMLLLPSTQVFAEPNDVSKMMHSLSAKNRHKFMKQVFELRKTKPSKYYPFADYELEYKRYSMEDLLKLAVKGKKITELDNYEKVKKFVIRPKYDFPELPKDIDNIPSYFFAKCYTLGVREFCVPSNIKRIGKGAFFGSNCLFKVIVPGSVTAIEKGAFFNCSYLREVKLMEGLKVISDRAFESCRLLEEIEIPASVESIGNEAFDNCCKLKRVILNEGIKRIGNHAFGSVELEELIIPSTVENVGHNPWDCKKLILTDGIERVHKNMTRLCSSLKEIELPDSIKYIDDEAFKWHKDLKDINFHENLVSIGTASFEGCSSLKEVVIPSSTIEIGNGAFTSCDNLERVKIPKRFEKRLGDIFYNCENIKEITLYDGNGPKKVIRSKKIRNIIKVNDNKIKIRFQDKEEKLIPNKNNDSIIESFDNKVGNSNGDGTKLDISTLIEEMQDVPIKEQKSIDTPIIQEQNYNLTVDITDLLEY